MTQHKTMRTFIAITLCTLTNGFLYSADNKFLCNKGPSELVYYRIGKSANTVIRIGDNTSKEHPVRESQKYNDMSVIDGKRFEYDANNKQYYPVSNSSAHIKIDQSKLDHKYTLTSTGFVQVNGIYYKASQADTYDNTQSNIYMIGEVLYENIGSNLQKIIVNDNESINLGNFGEDDPIDYESEEEEKEDEKTQTTPPSSTVLMPPSSTSSTPSVVPTSSPAPSTFPTPFVTPLLPTAPSSSSTSSTSTATTPPSSSAQAPQGYNSHNLTDEIPYLQRQLKALTETTTKKFNSYDEIAFCNKVHSNFIESLQHENVYTNSWRISTQTYTQKAVHFLGAATTLLFPAMHYAPLLLPVAIPTPLTVCAAGVSAISLCGWIFSYKVRSIL